MDFIGNESVKNFAGKGYPELQIVVIVGLVFVVRLHEHCSDKIVELFSHFSHSVRLI